MYLCTLKLPPKLGKQRDEEKNTNSLQKWEARTRAEGKADLGWALQVVCFPPILAECVCMIMWVKW